MGSNQRAVPTRPSSKRRHVLDADRFYCPYAGCARSFAELWRLKVHYRAAPDVRGSGKERGHGAELKACPKCGEELKPGRHHVGCAAGKAKLHRRLAARSVKAAKLQRRKRRVEEYFSPDEEDTEEEESDDEWDSDEDELEEVINSRRRRKARRRGTSQRKQNTARHKQVLGTPSGTAVGVPAQWIPLDFNLFSTQTPGCSFPGMGACPPPQVVPPPDETPFSLVFCNQESSLPVMATAQMGLGPDLDHTLDLSKIMDVNCSNQPEMGMKFEDINLELSPIQDFLEIDQAWEASLEDLGKNTAHTLEQQNCTFKRDAMLEAFPMGFNDGGMLGPGIEPVEFEDTLHTNSMCDGDEQILVQSPPVWEPLSTPVKDIGHYFMKGSVSKDFLTDDHRLMSHPAREMARKGPVRR